MSALFALVDCNNFYASCERVFQPHLNNQPIIVLSNNDGVVIARSKEAKQLGIGMGQPFFQIKELVQRSGVHVFSPNFSLYGDLSRRVMKTLEYFHDDIEMYSIDEAFIRFDVIGKSDLRHHAHDIRQTVFRWTGIPVSIGIGPTKTLAKAANELAKKDPSHQGVLDLSTVSIFTPYLDQLPIEDVWGIGRAFSKKLRGLGIAAAAQFAALPDSWVAKNLGTPGMRTVQELRGKPVLTSSTTTSTPKSIISSRSFGVGVQTIDQLMAALNRYASRAAEKLRADQCTTTHVTTYISSGRHNQNEYYNNSHTIRLHQATDYTPHLTAAARQALQKIFKPGITYKKAGIILTGLQSGHSQQRLFSDQKTNRHQAVNKALDWINQRWGKHTLHYATEDMSAAWHQRRGRVSPISTTDWRYVPTAFSE